MKCPRCQHENPPPGSFCSRCGEPLGAAVVAGPSYAQLRAENEELRRSLATATERQTATAEILRVISSSPTDVQPVFDAIVPSAVRLCDGLYGFVGRFDGEQIHIAAHHNYTPDALRVVQEMYPMRPSRQQVSGRVILTRSVVQIEDLVEDPEYVQRLARAGGWRASLGVPLLREGNAIGMITVMRGQPGPFSETQVELLKTFADQAVIAIENVRLFNELESRNRDLTQALDRQTATSDVLRIIAQSPTELQPVLDAIAASAVRLCAASDAVIERLEGDRFYNAAHAGTQMKGLVGRPLPLTRRFPGGRAVLDRRPVIIDDIHVVADREYPDTLELLKLNTIHSVAEIPLLSEVKPLGSLAVLRADVRPFTDAEIALLRTFADQAVIAIENVRLFTELQEKNRALTEAHAQVTESLEQQTATAEVLRVISSSPTDVQPVFKAIGESAVRLMGAAMASVYEFDGTLVHLHTLTPPNWPHAEELRRQYPRPPDVKLAAGRVILERAILHLADLQTDPATPSVTRQVAERMGLKGVLWVPMLREKTPIGVIGVVRAEAGLFSDKQVRLLQTFADQAVIAIENVRLFTELQARTVELTQSIEQLTALGEVSRAVSSTLDVETVLDTIVSRASQLAGEAGC